MSSRRELSDFKSSIGHVLTAAFSLIIWKKEFLPINDSFWAKIVVACVYNSLLSNVLNVKKAGGVFTFHYNTIVLVEKRCYYPLLTLSGND